MHFKEYSDMLDRWNSGLADYMQISVDDLHMLAIKANAGVKMFRDLYNSIFDYLYPANDPGFPPLPYADYVIREFKRVYARFGFVSFVFDFVQAIGDTFLTSALLQYFPRPVASVELLPDDLL